MNVPGWLAEWISRPGPAEAAAANPLPVGTVKTIAPLSSGLSLATEGAGLQISFLADDILEMRLAAPDDLHVPSFARLESPLVAPPGPVTAVESDQGISLRSRGLRIEIGRAPLRITIRSSEGDVVLADHAQIGLASTTRGWRAHWQLEPGDRVYGLGAKTGSLHRRGRTTTLWNRDMLVGQRTDPLYSAVPLLLIQRGGRWIGVLIDSAAHTSFDIGCTSPDQLACGPRTGPFAAVVFAGPALRDVLRQYTGLTGRMPLPPRWALGHHQSRWSYDDESEVRDLAREFRSRDIPTDAIHLDIHYMDGFRVFTFDRRRFPEPQRLAADLAQSGMKLVAIVDPGVKVDEHDSTYRDGREQGHFALRRDGRMFVMNVWPGKAAFPDFFRASVRAWWGDWHRVYADAGVAGIWNDMNEPSGFAKAWYAEDGMLGVRPGDLRDLEHRLDDGRTIANAAVHNAYGHEHTRATYEGLRRLRPNERPFILTRSAFAGTQRYAAQWTGDNISNWPALKQSIPMLLGLGLSGMPFAGCDIGGFVSDCTPELYARWIQIGSLSPFCRSHTALHTHRQEPWSFGRAVEAIARDALKLRYRLLPYLYTCFWEASQTGLPIWRPLFLEFPDEPGLVDVEDQVMVGPALLAAPVTDPGATERRVVLPRGTWFDWFSGSAVQGGQVITVDAPLQRLPLYVRAGSAVPTQEDVRHAEDRPEGPLVWQVLLDSAVQGVIGTLYEDDGKSFAYGDGEYRLTRVVAEAGKLRFAAEGSYVTPRQRARARVVGARAISVDGQPVSPDGIVEFANDGLEHVIVTAASTQNPTPGA